MQYENIIYIFIAIIYFCQLYIFTSTFFTSCFIIQSSKKIANPYTLSGITVKAQLKSPTKSSTHDLNEPDDVPQTQKNNLDSHERSSQVRPLNYYEKKEILRKILHDKNSELIKDLISKASPEELSRRRPKPRGERRLVATDDELIGSVSQDEGAETVEDTGYEEPTNINHVRAGHYVLHKNQVYTVSTTQHIAQARSKGHYKLKMKLLHTTKEMYFSFPDGCKMTVLTPRKVSCEYSHFDEDSNCYVFKSELSDISVPRGTNIASLKYLKPRLKVTISRWRDKILGVFVPFHIEYRVVQLNTGNYAATLDNGLVVLVPTYIKVNDHIEITTKACEFLRRTKIS